LGHLVSKFQREGSASALHDYIAWDAKLSPQKVTLLERVFD
jgi:hypothetical protein